MKWEHEVRDPIHAFVRMSHYERQVVDSAPFQRLRHIHQLALTNLVYPGATHKRFEHCLGVMELAGRVFDTVTQPEHLKHAADLVPQLTERSTLLYWRSVVRMAALCHDLGHQPFSHAGEELLPDGEDHESITERFIASPELAEILGASDRPIMPENVIELAVKRPGLPPWKQLLAEIVQSNFFGVDRIDYLLRDSLHAGVAYGRFDHFRLLDTVRILPPAPADDRSDGVEATPALGVERGGLQSAEALLLARHFMFRQVYLHPVRRIYDKHLEDFLSLWLDDGRFGTDTEALLTMDDNRVLVGIGEANADPDHPAHDPARRIARREHFKTVYEPTRPDYRVNFNAGHVVADALKAELGEDAVRHSFYRPKDAAVDFPVLVKGEVEAASSWLELLTEVPPTRFDAVFVAPDRVAEAEGWLKTHKDAVLEQSEGESDDEPGGKR